MIDYGHDSGDMMGHVTFVASLNWFFLTSWEGTPFEETKRHTREAGAHQKEDDDWWLDLYVMLSRATRLDDLLLMRAPDLSFFTKG